MKKVFFFILLLAASQLHAAELNVDATGAIPGSYPTISAAIAAGSDGDKVIIYTQGRSYIENLSIDKSLTFTSATPGDVWFLEGTITIVPALGREISIIGVYTSQLISTTTPNAAGARCVVNIVDSKILGGMDFDFDNYEINLLYNECEGDFVFRFGNLIGNRMGQDGYSNRSRLLCKININDEPALHGVGDTIKIIANYIYGFNINPLIEFENSSARYFLANNMIYNEYSSTVSKAFEVTNADLTDSANVFINNSISIYNTASSPCSSQDGAVELIGIINDNCTNNFFVNRYGGTSYGCALKGVDGMYNFFEAFRNSGGWPDDGKFNNYDVEGTNTYDEKTGILSAGPGIDYGKTGIQYLDLDLSPNDLGTGGGPYAWYNYHPVEGSGSGRARVWDLEIQSAVHSLTAPASVKAKSTHTK